MATFFFRGELILEMNCRCASLDVGLSKFKSIQTAAKSSFGVSNDRCKPIDLRVSIHMADLIGTLKAIIDAPD